jgi:hypothetical protein
MKEIRRKAIINAEKLIQDARRIRNKAFRTYFIETAYEEMGKAIGFISRKKESEKSEYYDSLMKSHSLKLEKIFDWIYESKDRIHRYIEQKRYEEQNCIEQKKNHIECRMEEKKKDIEFLEFIDDLLSIPDEFFWHPIKKLLFGNFISLGIRKPFKNSTLLKKEEINELKRNIKILEIRYKIRWDDIYNGFSYFYDEDLSPEEIINRIRANLIFVSKINGEIKSPEEFYLELMKNPFLNFLFRIDVAEILLRTVKDYLAEYDPQLK